MTTKVLFSNEFGIKRSQYELDFVDIILNGDKALYIDPFAIHHRADRFSMECYAKIVDYFRYLINQMQKSNKPEVLETLSHLNEPNETHLGLSSGNQSRGRGVGSTYAAILYDALIKSKAIKTGFLRDLEDCVLLIEGISHDRISDMTTNIIRENLLIYTQEQCKLLGVKVEKVAAGCIWKDNKWQSIYAYLPIYNNTFILLVPKALVRSSYSFSFSASEYYNRNILEYLQAEHLNSNTSLVRLLKSGDTRPPYKKTLKKLPVYEYSKEYLYEFSSKHMQVLRQYKNEKKAEQNYIDNTELLKYGVGSKLADISQLDKELENIKPGPENATKYHKLVFGLLEYIFYPMLIYPRIEAEIDEARKRVDIISQNAAKDGFFEWLHRVRGIPCAYIFSECKNYSSDPVNPEVDQLLGRFDANNGKFGFLLCRKIDNRALLIQRCRDSATKGRGFIVPLEDKDLQELLRIKQSGNISEMNQILNNKFLEIAI